MKNMVIVFRLTSSLLCLVFIFLALMDCSACAHEVKETNRDKLMVVEENVGSLKEIIVVSKTETLIGGRKMKIDDISRKKMVGKKKKLKADIKASKISGNEASKRNTKKLEDRSIDQGSKSQYPQKPASKNTEPQRLFDQATDEIMALMGKDYGKGKVKPRRKPPVNNDKPNH